MSRLPVDDPIYDVEAVWLGPPGWSLPRARYVAWTTGAAIFAALEVTLVMVGVTDLRLVTYTAAVSVYATKKLMRFVTFERPAWTVAVAFWHNVVAPREVTGGHEATLYPPTLARNHATTQEET